MLSPLFVACDGTIGITKATPEGSECDLNWEALEASGSEGWSMFANAAVDPDPFMSCGRCMKVIISLLLNLIN